MKTGMIPKDKLLEVANKGMWEYADGEDRCIKCGKYRFQDEHEEECPLGALLLLINAHR